MILLNHIPQKRQIYPTYTQPYTHQSRLYTLYTQFSHVRAHVRKNKNTKNNMLSRVRANCIFKVYAVYTGSVRVYGWVYIGYKLKSLGIQAQKTTKKAFFTSFLGFFNSMVGGVA